VAGVVDILMRVSEMACEIPEIEELITNPILVDEDCVIAVDAWLSVAAPQTSTAHYGHMAIHPYPSGLGTTWQTRDGLEIAVPRSITTGRWRWWRSKTKGQTMRA
jgi:acetyltransferase